MLNRRELLSSTASLVVASSLPLAALGRRRSHSTRARQAVRRLLPGKSAPQSRRRDSAGSRHRCQCRSQEQIARRICGRHCGCEGTQSGPAEAPQGDRRCHAHRHGSRELRHGSLYARVGPRGAGIRFRRHVVRSVALCREPADGCLSVHPGFSRHQAQDRAMRQTPTLISRVSKRSPFRSTTTPIACATTVGLASCLPISCSRRRWRN